MATWREFAAAEPGLAERVRTMFDGGRHKTMATLRADGAPRISGTECEITDEQIGFGSMPGARKLADLARNPRVAIHGPTIHPEPGRETEWPGEAKVAGRAVPVPPESSEQDDGAPEGAMFVLDLTEVVVTGLDEAGEKLVVEWWTPEGGLRRIERA